MGRPKGTKNKPKRSRRRPDCPEPQCFEPVGDVLIGGVWMLATTCLRHALPGRTMLPAPRDPRSYSLWLCGCGLGYVRLDLRGEDVSCPHCGHEDDADPLVSAPGPERTCTPDEVDVLLGHAKKPEAS